MVLSVPLTYSSDEAVVKGIVREPEQQTCLPYTAITCNEVVF